MFLGHFAAGLAAKPLAKDAPLGVLLLAPQWLDVVWPVLVLGGVERARVEPHHLEASHLVLEDMPYSHSLAMTVVWALFAMLASSALGLTPRSRAVVALLVMSHWALDVVAHEPDMPLLFAGPRLGLGLWRSVGATVATELAMFVVGVALYLRNVQLTRRGRIAFGILCAALVAGFLASFVGEPPAEITPLLVTLLVLFAALAGASWWIERRA